MKNFNLTLIGMIFSFLSTISCSISDDLKQISGTLMFSEVGTHSFSINAENIEATVTIVGDINSETQVYENVVLSNTVNYTAKISKNKTSKLLNNLVVMYEAKSGVNEFNNLENNLNSGYVKIDWKGFD